MLAIDIETVPADPDADGTNPDFLNSREFRLIGSGLGVRSRETDGHVVEVLFREGIDPALGSPPPQAHRRDRTDRTEVIR